MNGSTVIMIYWLVLVVTFVVYYRYQIYKYKKHTTAITILVGFNAILTAYIFYFQTVNHAQELTGTYYKYFDEANKCLFERVVERFLQNPDMKYLADSLFYDKPVPTNIQRNTYKEKLLLYEIYSCCAVYAQFYYTHIKFPEFKVLIENSKVRFFNILRTYYKSDLFQEYLPEWLDNLTGNNTKKFFKEFFNITQNNPKTEIEKKIAQYKIVDGEFVE